MLSVFAYHFALPRIVVLALGSQHLPLAVRGYAIIPNLDTGVEIFFVLSGYLIYRPFAAAHFSGAPRPAMRDYAIRRTARIFPAYWTAVLLLWLLHEITFGDHPAVLDVLPHVVLLQTYFSNARGGIPQAWTLVVEVSFYAFVPIAAWALTRTRLRGHVIALCGLTAFGFLARWYLLDHVVWRPLTVLPPALAALAPGMLLAVIDVTRAQRPQPGRAARIVTSVPFGVITAIVVFLIMTSHAATSTVFSIRTRSQDSWHDLLAPIVAAAFVIPIVLGVGRSRLRAAIAWRPLAWVGVVSYAAYLWHDALIYPQPGDHFSVPKSLDGDGRIVVLAVGALFLAATLVIAAASWYAIERPALRWAHRHTPR